MTWFLKRLYHGKSHYLYDDDVVFLDIVFTIGFIVIVIYFIVTI